jgi:hypothetical protein
VISVHAWVYEDGDVHVSINVQNRQNALGRKPSLTVEEKLALLSMIADELDDRFPDMEMYCVNSGAGRVTIASKPVAGLLTDRKREVEVQEDWAGARSHPFVQQRS